MELRQLGRSELRVPPLCFGGNVFGWTADQATSFGLLDRLVEAGVTFIDTADMYSAWVPGHEGGESERIIGAWLHDRGGRERLVIATKLGMSMGPGRSGLAPAYVKEAVEASLRRLRTDHIDLYQAHQDDPETPLEATLEALALLVEAGKVRVIGASNYSPARLEAALQASTGAGLPRFESLQPHYNLVERAGYEAELEPLCRKHGLGVIPYFSLASGFLTGKYRDEADLEGRARGQSAGKYLDERGRRVLAALDAVAARLEARPAQVALAWLMARPGITAPIASATTLEQLDELVAATRLSLDADDIRELDAASG